MFIALLRYTKPLAELDRFLDEHKAFLARHYATGELLISGRRVPRTGGVIVANVKTLAELESIVANDPYKREGLAEYEFIEFLPMMAAPQLAAFVEQG